MGKAFTDVRDACQKDRLAPVTRKDAEDIFVPVILIPYLRQRFGRFGVKTLLSHSQDLHRASAGWPLLSDRMTVVRAIADSRNRASFPDLGDGSVGRRRIGVSGNQG